MHTLARLHERLSALCSSSSNIRPEVNARGLQRRIVQVYFIWSYLGEPAFISVDGALRNVMTSKCVVQI